MRKELKEIIERVVMDVITIEDDLGLPMQSAWERIYYDFEDFVEDIKMELDFQNHEELSKDILKEKEIKEYAVECFYDVLEEYKKNH